MLHHDLDTGPVSSPAISFDDYCFSDNLGDFNAHPLPSTLTEFDLDLDQLTNPSPELSISDWDVIAQSENTVNPLLPSSSKSNQLSFLQLSPHSLPFETLPDVKFSTFEDLPTPSSPPPASQQQQQQQQQHHQQHQQMMKVAPSAVNPPRQQQQHPLSSMHFSSQHSEHVQHPQQFSPSSIGHTQPPSMAPSQTMYRPGQQSHAGVVKAQLVRSEYSGSQSQPSLFNVAATADSGSIPRTTSGTSAQDKDHQECIVNALSVSQKIAVATAYDYVRRVDDLDLGCSNWLASTSEATEVEIRAVRALFNPDRWDAARDIVKRIVQIVGELPSSGFYGPASSSGLSKASKHAIGRTKKRLSPKPASGQMALELQPIFDDSNKKRRT